MQVELIEKNASFLCDDEGILVATDIKKSEDVVTGELIYDGKNVAVLNRNNKEFFSFKNIPPFIRKQLKQSKFVTIIEGDMGDIYSYQVEVHLKNDLGFTDDFDEHAMKVLSELKEKMTPEEFDSFLREAEKFIQNIN